MPKSSLGQLLFRWPVNHSLALIDFIRYPKKRRQQRRERKKQQENQKQKPDSPHLKEDHIAATATVTHRTSTIMARKLILSTGNIVSGGPSIIRKPGDFRSNLELTNSLRSNFLAAKQDSAYTSANSTSTPPSPAPNGHTATPNGTSTIASTTPPIIQWTSRDSSTDTLYIPHIDWTAAPGLQEDPTQYEITAKLFLLPTSTLAHRAAYAREALALVMRELRVSSVSLLIVSFPGMSFEGDCEWEADKLNATQGDDAVELETWREAVEPLYREGLVKKLGIAEFGSEKLARFLEGVEVKPEVDQINIKNCCNVPPPLVKLAKEKGIELFVHSDCTDILPTGTLRELLGQGVRGAGVLADPVAEEEDGKTGEGLLRGDIMPQWVIKYTAVVRDRGVIENKGYFAGAGLVEE